jgi:imidazolonepropionase-like amidohydrolase
MTGDIVLIKGSRLAYVGNKADKAIVSPTKVIDPNGKNIIPGLIDDPTHMGIYPL